ncbi:MAG: hypothetical protein ABSC25_15945 [Roseiarcus sp.]
MIMIDAGREALAAAIDEARRVPDGMQTSLAAAQMRIDEAVAAVIADEPATRALVEGYMRHAAAGDAMRRVLEFLSSRKALPSDLRHWWAVEEHREREAVWGAAWKSLTVDANAPLPIEPDLLGSAG